MIGSTPLFSVSEFIASFSQTLEAVYPEVKIVGELSDYKVSKNRWIYFDLKDDQAKINFFGDVFKLPGPLEEGMNLEVTGKPRMHPVYGFSINVQKIAVVGEGSIAKAKQLLANKLKKEGLFDDSRKRQLPYPPNSIGIITSKDSAGYSDFIKILSHRWGSISVELFDCQVQGVEAPDQIIEGISYFNQQAEFVDVLVLIRGGGSADDLSSFDHEQVVRAVAASRIPTLVAVGHERDVCMAELAADKRASTPSNAAELLAPDRKSEFRNLNLQEKQLKSTLSGFIKYSFESVNNSKELLTKLVTDKINQLNNEVKQKEDMLRVLNPSWPMKRGFAIIKKQNGKIIKSVDDVAKDEILQISVSNGQIDSKVINKRKKR